MTGPEMAMSEDERVRREFNHRLKNVFASVQALIRTTQSESTDVRGFVKDLEGRIFTLSRLNDVLFDQNFEAADLRDLMTAVLMPFDSSAGQRLDLEGPGMLIRGNPAQSIAFSVHELMVHARKVGAFSDDSGRISVSWRVEDAQASPQLVIEWREDSPPDRAEMPDGYGWSFIKSAIADVLGGKVAAEVDPRGLHAVFTIPADYVLV